MGSIRLMPAMNEVYTLLPWPEETAGMLFQNKQSQALVVD